jgi:peptide/nickel transport system substrate-binding protein
VRGLRRIGVDVGLKGVEYQAWFERLQKGDFDLSMAWSDLSTTPHGLYRGLMSTETVRPLGELAAENWHRFGLPEADRLLRELEATVDRQQSWNIVSRLQHLFVEHAPAIPLFPGPLWGEFNARRFEGFPDAEHPYAPLSPYIDDPQPLLVLTRVRPR